MTRSKNLTLAIIFFLTLAGIVGVFKSCGSIIYPPIAPIAPECKASTVAITDSQKTNDVTVEIYIDSTPSMEGYVVIPKSRYAKTLDYIDSAARTLEAKKIQYYKFGLAPISSNASETYKDAQKPEFYKDFNRGNENFKTSYIEKAVSVPLENKLSVIITDLYQTKNEIGSVVTKLNPYLKDGYGVGILGIKSEFKGKVHDVGVNAVNFDYDTSNKKLDKYHPFYLIITGKYENVKKYYEQLKQKDSEVIKDENFIIFSSSFVSKPSLLDNNSNSSKELKGLKRQATIFIQQKNGKNTPVKTDDHTEKLGVIKSKDLQGSISSQADYSPLLYTLPIKSLKASADIQLFKASENNFVSDQKLTSKIEVSLKDFSFNSNQLTSHISFNLETMKKGTYLFNIDLIPETFDEPSWWKEWDWGDAQDDKELGDKTYSLNLFMSSLRDITVNKDNKGSLGKFCYVINKDS